ncbi:DUF4468 domain-containing protein [Telluribacter sp. SYSU D00476]|uniref:DUF4468 domain-containing protein n=1 Tax=Telluribacter sp. SYSU D00476 TaxID=2811430 RepID=UPI001FF1E508|nr:DUF4468 domain-containing protein [Telluribacter sp. SYSU D00476]
MFSYISYAQDAVLPTDSSTGEVIYTEVVEVENSKETLFKNAQKWIAKSYGDYKSVIQLEDKDRGRLIFKGISDIDRGLFKHIRYVVTIDVKDNAYRCKIANIEYGYDFSAHGTGMKYVPVEKIKPEKVYIKIYQDEIENYNKQIAVARSEKQKVELQKKVDDVSRQMREFKSKSKENTRAVIDRINDLMKSLKSEMAQIG